MSGKETSSEEFVDPQPPARLSRRNIIALALTIAGVLLVLFLGSRRPRPEPEPGYMGRAPVELDREPFVAPTPWSAPPEEKRHVVLQQARQEDHRLARFEEAMRSRPLVTSVESEDGREQSEQAAEKATKKTIGPYTVAEGAVIEAALMTAIHSARPGPVAARVVLPVYDSVTGWNMLIPAGTRLIGSMEQAIMGQDRRVILAWTRMIFPNGESLDLPGLPSIETAGEGGLSGRVKTHRARIFGSAALLALLGTSSAQASTGLDGVGGIMGATMALELSRVATGMVAEGLKKKPTVTVPPGYRFLVYVSQDLVFESPYE